MRTVSLQQLSAGATVRAGADLLVESPCEEHKLLDWASIDKIMETGYRAAVPAIERWQAEQRGVPA